ncbi:MAG: T9SS type A sorting domain-containing protein [Bacteroidaceae bacterium]|nr:T9SS type A sorting domain-containing protein [Bacteroidaceae bacterium]
MCGSAFADRIENYYDAAGNRLTSEKVIIFTRGSVNGNAPEEKMYQDSLASTRITIYPNPTEGDLKIDIAGVSDFESSGLILYDMAGKVVKNITQLSESNELDITDYANGMYIMVIKINEESTTWKIVKK